jgi:hypothetical protein
MMLSLAIALVLATTFGAEAARRAKTQKKADATKIAQMVTVSGECTKLIHAGHPVDGCKNILLNMNYSTGVSAYWFMTDRNVLSFSGDGSRRIEQGPDLVVQSIERVVAAVTTGVSKEGDAREDAAVGFCRFGDPTKKGSMLECVAHTQAGLYEGAFVTDGTPPQLEAFPISP